MPWIELVTVLVIAQYLYFGALVARARGKYGVNAPAVTGNEMFERFYRVQMNTLELLPIVLAAMWLAAPHFSHWIVAGTGAVYLVGRMLYLRAYTRDPKTRSLGFSLSMFPPLLLIAAVGVRAVIDVATSIGAGA